MKILVVIPTLGYGGAERLLVTLLPKLKEKGVNIRICTLSTPLDLAYELEKEGISVINLGLKHRWSIFEVIVKLYKEVKYFHPNVIWAHLYFGIIYSRVVSFFFPKVKLISVLHDSIYGDYKIEGIWYTFRNWVYQKTKFIDNDTIAVSNTVKTDYENFFGWKNIKVIYNAIELEKIDLSICSFDNRNIINDKFHIDHEDFLIIVPGRLDKRKGHYYVIQAIEKLNLSFEQKIKVLFIGEGPLKEELVKETKSRDVWNQIIFTGNLDQKTLFKIISVSNLVIIPSIREPFGIAAVEVMYIGKPLIVTAVDGLKEITTHDYDAIQVPAKNSDAIAETIIRVIKDSEYSKYLTSNAKVTASNYDVNVIVKKWIELFEREMK